MTSQKHKIILSGYRATGKSTIGRLLAERLDLAFIDMDEVLVAQHGEITDLVKERGWGYFRDRERELLEELVASQDVVISTGGGAVLHRDVWRELKKTGLVVWLTADLETICRRLEADLVSESQRPSLTGDDIKAETGKVLAEREPLYRAGAHLIVDATRPVAEVVAEIEQVFAKGT